MRHNGIILCLLLPACPHVLALIHVDAVDDGAEGDPAMPASFHVCLLDLLEGVLSGVLYSYVA
jgi:hypothetical protein